MLLALALVVVALLYLPVLGYGLVNLDDDWLVRDNVLLRSLSVDTLATVFFDTSAATRFVLGAEYLPIRDISVALDHAVWGSWYGGHHLTSLVIYLACIAVWFRALCELGVDRTVAGVAILIWAVMPAHAESVAWVSERKGVLGVMFAGGSALGYAKFRAGQSAAWIAVAALCAICAVWSKAPSAFAVAVLAPIELVCRERRTSWRRSLLGLAAIAVAGALAFVPVVVTATNLSVVGSADAAPAGYAAMAAGLHGFYLELALMMESNAISYPISSVGPSPLDIALGIAGALLAIVALLPARGRFTPPLAVRVGALIWIIGYLPASRLVLPLRAVLVNDRYILFASLGIALAFAGGVLAIRSPRARAALIATVVLAGAVSTLDARSTWRDSLTLWQRATQSNPHDGAAWSAYIELLLSSGQPEAAWQALELGRSHSNDSRLVMRHALMTLDTGDRARGIELLEEAATAGESRAMANLALMRMQDRRGDDALRWARKAVQTAPMYARGHRTLGEVALALGKPVEAWFALERAYALAPADRPTRYLLALALLELKRPEAARPHLEACIADPKVGASCASRLGQLRR